MKSYAHGPEVDEILYQEDYTKGETLFFHQDNLMSTLALTDSQGHVKESYTYDPYGNFVSRPSSLSTSFLYTGRELDPETNLYYDRARYYDPTLGRFISADPKGYAAGLNLYTYTHNNPLTYRDPQGTDEYWGGGGGFWGAIGGFFSGFFSGFASAVSSFTSAVSSAVSSVASAVSSAAHAVASAVSSAANAVSNAVSSAASAVSSAVLSVVKTVSNAVSSAVKAIASAVTNGTKALGSALARSAGNLLKFDLEQVRGVKSVTDAIPPGESTGIPEVDVALDVFNNITDGVEILAEDLKKR